MQLLIKFTLIFVLFNLNSAFPHHDLTKRQLEKLEKLSYAVLPNNFESTSDSDSVSDTKTSANHHESNNLLFHDQQNQETRSPTQTTSTSTSTLRKTSDNAPGKYSTLVTRIVKQILSKRTKSSVVSEYRRRKNIEQMERNDLIKSSMSDKKFRIISELTLKRLKPAFEIQLPEMTPEEHDELVSDINKLINEDGSFRRDGKS